MITVSSIDTSRLNAGLRGLARVGIPLGKIIPKEMGELIKTLVKLSPPKNKAKSSQKTTDHIQRRFELVGMEHNAKFGDGQMSKTGIEWVSVNHNWLRGAAPDLDMRKADVPALRKLYYSTTKRGNVKKDFRHPRTHQRVLLVQRIITTPAKIKALARKVVGNYGRLKAGWLVSVFRGPIRLAGANMPPAWVTKHQAGAKGAFENRLNSVQTPSFTIMNRAKGVSQRTVIDIARMAIKVRLQSMLKNAQLYIRGKKNIADYANAR